MKTHSFEVAKRSRSELPLNTEPRAGSDRLETQFLSAKGAKCESLGQRPRLGSLSFEALKARDYVVSTEYSSDCAASNIISRLQRSEVPTSLPGPDGPGFHISRLWRLEPEVPHRRYRSRFCIEGDRSKLINVRGSSSILSFDAASVATALNQRHLAYERGCPAG